MMYSRERFRAPTRENELRVNLEVKLAGLALLTCQSRPPPDRALSQPLPDEREALDCSVSFCMQDDEPSGRPFLRLIQNPSLGKTSGFVEDYWLRTDDRILQSTPWPHVRFSDQCATASCSPRRFQLRPYRGTIFGNPPRSSADNERVEATRLERLSGRVSRISWDLLLAG